MIIPDTLSAEARQARFSRICREAMLERKTQGSRQAIRQAKPCDQFSIPGRMGEILSAMADRITYGAYHTRASYTQY